MANFELYKNHERMQTISEAVREQLNTHEVEGGTYFDDRAEQIAGFAIQSMMPQLASLRGNRVVIDSARGIVIEKDDVTKNELYVSYDGTHVEAQFARVALQPMVEIVAPGYTSDGGEDEKEVSAFLTTYDLFAVVRPRYVDPDPKDIVFGEEMHVPFSTMELFEPVNS